MGDAQIENGIALGRTLYLGHGTRTSASDRFVYEDSHELLRNGFTPYCVDPTNRPPLEDNSELSKHSRAAGIAFALSIDSQTSGMFKKRTNFDLYSLAISRKIGSEFRQDRGGIACNMILDYTEALTQSSGGKRPILNENEPGTDDSFSVILERLRRSQPSFAVAFQRSGICGFDLIVRPLVYQTLLGVMKATEDFGW